MSNPQITHSAIAAHNDGVLAWVFKVANLFTDDGSTKRYPALSSAVERFSAVAKGLIAQTGFLPTGSAAGIKESEVNKPFAVLPWPQANGFVYAMANPRLTDQDSAVLVAIIGALSTTVDETSTRDHEGNQRPGGGYAEKKKDANPEHAQPAVKTNNKTFNAICKELRIKKEGKTFTLDSAIKAGLRAECPAFPAEAATLPTPKGRPSPAFNIPVSFTVKGADGKKTAKSIMLYAMAGAFDVLAFLTSLPKSVTVGDVTNAREEMVLDNAPLFAERGITLLVKGAAKAGKKTAATVVTPSEAPAEDIAAAS